VGPHGRRKLDEFLGGKAALPGAKLLRSTGHGTSSEGAKRRLTSIGLPGRLYLYRYGEVVLHQAV
jgi:hypothetical protein